MSNRNIELLAYLGISTHAAEEEVLRLSLELAATVTSSEAVSLLVSTDQATSLHPAMTVGNEALVEQFVGDTVATSSGTIGLAMRTGEVQVGAPVFHDAERTRPFESIDHPHVSILAAPMLIADDPIGVVTAVETRADKLFSSEDTEVFGRVASVIGLLVDQERRLAASLALARGETPAVPIGEHERDERDLVDAISRLVRSGESRPREIAAVLRTIAELIETTP